MKTSKIKKFSINVSLNEIKVIDGKVYLHIFIGTRNKWISYHDANNENKVCNG